MYSYVFASVEYAICRHRNTSGTHVHVFGYGELLRHLNLFKVALNDAHNAKVHSYTMIPLVE